MALDPKTHRIYLPTAQFQPAPSPIAWSFTSTTNYSPEYPEASCYGRFEQAKH
jgi:hypothetical protein